MSTSNTPNPSEETENLSRNTVNHLAQLSRIGLEENEVEELTHDLGKIIGMVNKVAELNTDGLEPLYNIEESHANVLRADKIKPTIPPETIAKNSKHFDSGHFVVPQVVE